MPIADLVVLKAFDAPDETRRFSKGVFELVRVGGLALGRATYEPGWRWAVDVGRPLGARACEVEHVGYVVSGACGVGFDDGSVKELRAGCLFHIPGKPHDSWVIGDTPYVSLHLLGADTYGR